MVGIVGVQGNLATLVVPAGPLLSVKFAFQALRDKPNGKLYVPFFGKIKQETAARLDFEMKFFCKLHEPLVVLNENCLSFISGN